MNNCEIEQILTSIKPLVNRRLEEFNNKMPQPQNGMIGITSQGHWFILLDKDEYFKMIYLDDKNSTILDKSGINKTESRRSFNCNGVYIGPSKEPDIADIEKIIFLTNVEDFTMAKVLYEKRIEYPNEIVWWRYPSVEEIKYEK